jgi:hypothetical protein
MRGNRFSNARSTTGHNCHFVLQAHRPASVLFILSIMAAPKLLTLAFAVSN